MTLEQFKEFYADVFKDSVQVAPNGYLSRSMYLDLIFEEIWAD